MPHDELSWNKFVITYNKDSYFLFKTNVQLGKQKRFSLGPSIQMQLNFLVCFT